MKEKIQIVELLDFEETDEDTTILAIENLNDSIGLLIICENYSLLVHIKDFENKSLKLTTDILKELKKLKIKIIDSFLFIGSNCNINNLEEFITSTNLNIKIIPAYKSKYGNESIAYDSVLGEITTYENIKKRNSKTLKKVI